jgi:hypothetical protein
MGCAALSVVTVRIEYGGMRMENQVPAGFEDAKLLDMYKRHGITPTKGSVMRGRVDMTGSRVQARFIQGS